MTAGQLPVRKMQPPRHIDCAGLTFATDNVAAAYADALLVATPTSHLIDDRKPAKLVDATRAAGEMERENSTRCQYTNAIEDMH